ncbi:hypothetical protein Tco_1241106 [Tanacetum coccineum]
MIIKKDSEIVKAKGERKYVALKAKKESSDEECSTFGSKDEEYVMAVRDFKISSREEVDKNQRAFIGGSWSDSGEEDDEKAKDETCLMAQAARSLFFQEFMHFPLLHRAFFNRFIVQSLPFPSNDPASPGSSTVRAPFPPYAPPAQAYHASRLRRFRQTSLPVVPSSPLAV